MKIIKRLLVVLLIVFLIAQFFGPVKNEGKLTSTAPFLLETNTPANVKLILENACFDCHSNATKYPWYSSITPVNYWMASHIKEAKKHFNVSNWQGNSTKRKVHKFDKLIALVQDKTMPLNSYTWAHAKAKLSDEQIKAVIDWANLVRITYSLEKKPE